MDKTEKDFQQEYIDTLNAMLSKEREHRSFLLRRVKDMKNLGKDFAHWVKVYEMHVHNSEQYCNDVTARIQVQKLKMEGKAYRSEEYICGFDCAVNGSNPFNCRFTNFLTIEARDEWQNGYDDGLKSKA